MTQVEHGVLDVELVTQALNDLGFLNLSAFISYLSEMNDIELLQLATNVDSTHPPNSPVTILVKGQLRYLAMLRSAKQGGGTRVVDSSLRKE